MGLYKSTFSTYPFGKPGFCLFFSFCVFFFRPVVYILKEQRQNLFFSNFNCLSVVYKQKNEDKKKRKNKESIP